MLELFLTTIVILLFLLGFIYLFGTFKIINVFLYVCQLIFAIVLVSITLYKKHILMDDLITHVHNKTFNAIIDLVLVENNLKLQMNFESNLNFSTIKDSVYFNECIENYFISSSECPITDIIIENEKKDNHDNYTEIKINDNKYLYYTKEKKKDGKLYKFHKDKMSVDDLNFESNFNYITSNRIKRIDEDRANNSFSNFKNFIFYGDLIILIVIIHYIFYIFIEPYDNKKFDFHKIFNITYELAILVFYIIRYAKFLKFKKFLLDNEDFYKDKTLSDVYDKEKKYYFPNKVFNLDSFPVSISINILLVRIIYLIFPKKWHYYFKEEINLCFQDEELATYVYFVSKSKIIYGFFLFALSIWEGGLFRYHDNLKYNWNTNPIKSIKLSDTKDYEFGRIKTKKRDYPFYNWRGKYFKIEKINNLNYLNIYTNENGKICGKDSYGNDLYFPNDIECPINDIIIDNNNKNYEGYKEIQLDNGKSLYYTNKKVSKKITIDLKAHPINYKLNLNLKKTNKICEDLETVEDLKLKKCKEYDDYDIEAYIKIDDWDYNSFFIDSSFSPNIKLDEKKKLNLVGITYFGFDPSSIKERKKIKTLERNLNTFKAFFILQIIFFVLSTILVFSSLLLICNRDHNNKKKCLIFIIFFAKIIMIIFEIIMYLISLIIRIKDIHNFIFKIIYKDEKNEKEYKGIIYFYIIILIALFSLLISIINFYFHFLKKIILERKEDSNQSYNNEISVMIDNNNLNAEKKDKKENNEEKSKFHSSGSNLNNLNAINTN